MWFGVSCILNLEHSFKPKISGFINPFLLQSFNDEWFQCSPALNGLELLQYFFSYFMSCHCSLSEVIGNRELLCIVQLYHDTGLFRKRICPSWHVLLVRTVNSWNEIREAPSKVLRIRWQFRRQANAHLVEFLRKVCAEEALSKDLFLNFMPWKLLYFQISIFYFLSNPLITPMWLISFAFHEVWMSCKVLNISSKFWSSCCKFVNNIMPDCITVIAPCSEYRACHYTIIIALCNYTTVKIITKVIWY